MKPGKLKKLLTELIKYQDEADSWLISLPDELRSAFDYNTYNQSLVYMNKALINFIIDDEYIEYLWYEILYLGQFPGEIFINNRKYVIDNIDDMVNLIVKEKKLKGIGHE